MQVLTYRSTPPVCVNVTTLLRFCNSPTKDPCYTAQSGWFTQLHYRTMRLAMFVPVFTKMRQSRTLSLSAYIAVLLFLIALVTLIVQSPVMINLYELMEWSEMLRSARERPLYVGAAGSGWDWGPGDVTRSQSSLSKGILSVTSWEYSSPSGVPETPVVHGPVD